MVFVASVCKCQFCVNVVKLSGVTPVESRYNFGVRGHDFADR